MDLSTFGAWLQQRRRLMGLSRKQFAEQAHFSTATIKGFELDLRRPSVSAAKTLAEALCIPANLLSAFITFSRGDAPAPDLLRLVQVGTQAQSVMDSALSVRLTSRFVAPSPVTALLGREASLERALQWLHQPAVRLLSVLGPPGVGKTRFSLELAHQLRKPFNDHVFFVSLAPVSRSEDLAEALCDVILPAYDAAQNSDSDALTTLKRFIASKSALLILDNFEHLLNDATVQLVSDLLATAPELKIVVTSREVLHAYGEHRLILEPLSLPTSLDLASPELPAHLQHYAAIALFVERAQAIRPEFELTVANALAVAQLCEMLDGLPLAIEIAASHLDHFPLPRLLHQLASNKLALHHEQRGAAQRHQSLHNLISHSHALLNPDEQRVFCALSVFAGGADEAAVAAVLADAAADSASVRVQDHLHALAAKSLITHEIVEDAARFSMLQTLREYSLDVLTANGQLFQHRHRLAQYCVAFAKHANDHMDGEHYVHWMNQFELNHNNCRSALLWCQQHDVELGLEMATAWADFWYQRGHVMEGYQWLTRLLGLITDTGEVADLAALRVTTLTQVRAMCVLTKFCWTTGPLTVEQVLAVLEDQCLPLVRQRGNAYDEALVLCHISETLFCCEQESRGRVVMEDALQTLRAIGRDQDVVAALHWLIPALLSPDVQGALSCAEEALERSQNVGNPSLIAKSIQSLSVARRWSKDYEGAVAAGREAVALYRRIYHKVGLLDALIRLAHALIQLKGFAECRVVLQEYLEVGQQLGLDYVASIVHRQLGHIDYLEGRFQEAAQQLLMSAEAELLQDDRRDVGQCLTILVPVMARLGHFHAAVHIAAAALAFFASLDHTLYVNYQVLVDEGLALAREQLSEVDFAAAQAQGRDMSLEQALAEVRGVV